MVKKYPAELVQEDGEKLTPMENQSVIEVKAEKVTEETVIRTEELRQPKPKQTPEQDIITSKNDLEIAVQKLKQTLEEYQNQEKILQQQIVDLQSVLYEKQVLTEKLTKELHEAKQTALQLAEANSQLIAESNSTVQVKQKNSPTPAKEEKSAIQVKEKYNPAKYIKSRRIPEHLIERKKPDDNFAENTWLYD